MAGEGFQLRLVRTKVGVVDDADPNVSAPPATELLRLASYRENINRPIWTRGYHAKLVFTTPAANTADIEVWVLNTVDNTWALAGTLPIVPHARLFIQDDIDDAIIFFRLRNITGGGPIQIWGEEA